MIRDLHSFKIRSEKKFLDYRLGEKLNLSPIKIFFQKKYLVKKLWQGPRHILGILEKDETTFFLKLSTSKGISVVTKKEYKWNDYFNNFSPANSKYLVAKNYDSGLYKRKYFYLITDYFDGKLLCDIDGDASFLIEYIPQVIDLSEIIQQLPRFDFTSDKYEEVNYQRRFLNKTRSWFSDIPINISKKFNVKTLLELVENGASQLSSKPRHGDFTPWHMIRLPEGKLGLIDGEHALPDSVQNYDICYFIQRVFSVLKNPSLAQNIYSQLLAKGYEKNKLRTVLAARAIGGFLDESLIEKSEYNFANKFKDWIIQLD